MTFALPSAPGLPRAWPAPLVLAAVLLGHLATDLATTVLFAAGYTLKRRLDIDVVPGVDMLPDPQIEAAIRAAAALVGL